jgi:DNA invertase Pin-like site-specific DNA recombinase
MQTRQAPRATRPWRSCRKGRAGKTLSERAHLAASTGARARLLESVERLRTVVVEELGRFARETRANGRLDGLCR